MDRYHSGEIALPPLGARTVRADLVFYGVDQSGPSYEARVFLNTPEATIDTPTDLANGYVGSFTIFGHAGCAGAPGHCDEPVEREDPFDVRTPRGVPRISRLVILGGEELKRLSGETFSLTLVPVEAGPEGPVPSKALDFSSFRLATYES